MGKAALVAVLVVCAAAAGWFLRGSSDPVAPPPPIDMGAKVAPPRSPDLDAAPGGAGVSGDGGAPQLRGAQLHSLWYDGTVADMERELDLVADAGGDTVRIDLAWSSLETNGKGDFSSWYVTKADTFLTEARERGLNVIGTLWATPCWASSAPEDKKLGCEGPWWDRGVDRYAPVNPSDYADAAAWVAQRWGSKLVALEIWNEPNLPDKYSLQAPDPAVAYAEILKAAYPKVKQVAPGLRVVGGALAFSDGTFLERLYDLGIKDHFDAFSIHPYNEWRDPDDPWKTEWRKYTFLTGIPWVRSVMEAHGDGEKGLWLTEFGFSTCGTGSTWCVTEDQQAEFINDSFRIAAGWNYVEAAIAYNLRNKGSDPQDRESQFGLVARDFTPKPGYRGFRAAMAREAAPSTRSAEPPAAVTEAPAATQPQPEPSPSVSADPAPVPFGVTLRGLTRRGSALSVQVRCGAGPCNGTVIITGRGKRRLGTARLRAASGRTVRVRVPIRRTLARRARVAVAVRGDTGGGARATIAKRSFVVR